MARYDREFLVPYLEDICALHLSKQRLNAMISDCNSEISRINRNALQGVKSPQLEAYKTDADLDGCGTGCLGAICGIGAIGLFFAGLMEPSLMVLALVLAVMEIVLIFRGLGAKGRANDEIRQRNDEKERDHAIEEMAALIVVQPEVDVVKERIKVFENEKNKVDALLEQLYSINVIPRWYRDLYPAVYLYDWFSNSRADDLDLALNTLVLEQIKDRLDTIIRNQSEMIINQRIMIANQRQSMEQAERHYQMLTAKLNQIGASIEDQKMYLSMIEANSAANAYFAAANYLKR